MRDGRAGVEKGGSRQSDESCEGDGNGMRAREGQGREEKMRVSEVRLVMNVSLRRNGAGKRGWG
jgi:hypothetical protein